MGHLIARLPDFRDPGSTALPPTGEIVVTLIDKSMRVNAHDFNKQLDVHPAGEA
jgi:hypothetical protein